MVGSKHYLPTVHRLFYLLGDLSIRWQTIGKKLRLSNNKLAEINADHMTSFRRMIAMFEHWLHKADFSWADIIQVLISIDEEELAWKVSAYVSEMERLESTTSQLLTERRMVPIKGSSFEDKIIRHVYYENETLARKSIITVQEFNEIVTCLMDVRHKWYEIGIALGVPKAKLDEIDYLNPKRRSSVHSKMRLMLQYAQEVLLFTFTWKRLIDALIDLDLYNCARHVESIAPQHTTCTSQCRLDVYRRQDFVSRTKLTEDKKFIKQVKILRKILKLDPSITDKEVLSNLFQHISSIQADISREKEIIETVKVIQKLSAEHALESEQQADDIIEDTLYHGKQSPSFKEHRKRI